MLELELKFPNIVLKSVRIIITLYLCNQKRIFHSFFQLSIFKYVMIEPSLSLFSLRSSWCRCTSSRVHAHLWHHTISLWHHTIHALRHHTISLWHHHHRHHRVWHHWVHRHRHWVSYRQSITTTKRGWR